MEGKGPVNLFTPNINRVKDTRFPIDMGMVPDILAAVRFKVVMMPPEEHPSPVHEQKAAREES